ncbi:hypothetical protein CesoFtcFv8_009946 [Champsocephalus esox]|uniref:Lysosome-associated membrane glycoprotein 2 n=1 Tax=Champsocephalus esox TaxID=159716 RepID=A0AAN8GYP3_9TELE|nr:hypothetical protein CesoFtcFv8_009946 [Champsocephalus esox]
MHRCATFVVFLVLGIAIQLSNGTEVNVKDKDNNVCLYAKLMVNFRVSYEVAINEILTAEFELPASVASDGSTCDNTSSTLKLNFGEGHSWSVNFTTEGKLYHIDTITFSYNLSDASIFPNSTLTETTTIYVKPQIKDVGVDTCYSCKSEDTYETDLVRQTLWNVLIQAFVINNSTSENITPSRPACWPTLACGFKIKDEEMNFEPNGTAVTGKCEVNSSELVLTSSTVTIKFTFTNDTKKFRLHALNVTGKTSSGVAFSVANTNLSLWEAAVGSSYMCNKEQNYTISADLSIYTFELRVQPLAVKKGIFSTAHECSLDDTSILIPIIVGAALAGLILIVVIAYMIGRRKTYVGYQTL